METTINERIEEPVPAALMLKIKTGEAIREVSIYDLIANFIGLNLLRQDIYVDESGEEFIRTKYGFHPATRYNHNLKIKMCEQLIDELKYKLKIAKEKEERYEKMIEILEAKNHEKNEKLKMVTLPFVDQNNDLKKQNKLLRQELNEFKQITDSIMRKLTRLTDKADLNEDIEQTSASDLDWSNFDTALGYNDK